MPMRDIEISVIMPCYQDGQYLQEAINSVDLERNLHKEIVQLPETLFHYRIKKNSRTTAFLGEQTQVKATFRQIYAHHQAFYQKHAACYACLLRDELIQEQYEKQKLMEEIEMLLRLKRMAPVNWLVKHLLRK